MNTTPANTASQSDATRIEPFAPEWPQAGARVAPAEVMFSIPRIAADEMATAPYTTVPLVVPSSTRLQNLVQSARQRFLDVAGGSRFWRIFIGGGFAVFVGALTLIVLGPPPEQSPHSDSESTKSSVKSAEPGRPVANPVTGRGPQVSGVELTVSEHEGSSPQPAEYDDPFVEQNRVTGTAQHAVHFSNSGDIQAGQAIHQVSNRRLTDATPAWLSGTIDADEQSSQPLRNHERSRPSHR